MGQLVKIYLIIKLCAVTEQELTTDEGVAPL